MSKRSLNGKYLELDKVRVFYDEENDRIHLTSQDPDFPQGTNFKVTLNGGKASETALREMLYEKGLIKEESSDSIPRYASLEEREPGKLPWHTIPLGIGHNRKEIIWQTFVSPHMLIAGYPYSTENTFEQSILQYCLNDWELYAITGGANGFYSSNNIPSASTLAEAAILLEFIDTRIKERHELIRTSNVSSIEELSDVKNGIMLVIDDDIFNTSISESSEDEKLRRQALKTINKIARVGRSVGIQLLVKADQPNENLPYQFYSNLTTRVLMGKINERIIKKFFNKKSLSTLLPAIKNRGYVESLNIKGGSEFQGYTIKDN